MNKNELYDYNAMFLSLVPQGANKKDFFILKSEDGMNLDAKAIAELEGIFKAELSEDVQTSFGLIEKSELSEKSQRLAKGALRLLGSIDKGSSDIIKEIIAKAKHGFPFEKPMDEDEEKKKKEEKAKLEEKVKKSESESRELPSNIKKSIEKFISKEHRGAFDKIMKETFNCDRPTTDDPAVVSIMKENERISKELSDERSIRITKELEVEAVENYSDLNGNKTELASILKDADENMGKENVAKMREIFKSANAQIKDGEILKQLGSGLTPTSNEWEAIEKAAESVNKDGKLSKEAAIDKYLETEVGKKAYADYEARS